MSTWSWALLLSGHLISLDGAKPSWSPHASGRGGPGVQPCGSARFGSARSHTCTLAHVVPPGPGNLPFPPQALEQEPQGAFDIFPL